MLDDILKEQEQSLHFFYKQLDRQAAASFAEACLQCQGLLVLTGVGKSGIIAEKIAMTLISTGTRALYLPPTNFLHGDIGILSPADCLIMLSKSGETEELLNLIPFVRKRQAKLLAVVSNPQSRLGRASDLFISLPVEKELCPFDLAPTISTEVQLLFGDALAMHLMKSKNFSLDDYALNHPSGTIGKKMHLRLEDLMFKDKQIPLCRPEDRLLDILVELSNKKCGCVLITDPDQRLLGIFTDGDLRRSLQRGGSQVLEEKMEALMTPNPISLPKSLLAWDVIKIMQKDPKRYIMAAPVVDEGKVVGVIRMHDIIQSGLTL